MPLFVTGTGTDVGKTVVSAALAAGLTARDSVARYWKPIQTGGDAVDATVLRQLCPGVDLIPSWRTFAPPLSPDQAAEQEGIAAPTLAEFMHLQKPTADIVEGAGGLFVPWNEANETWLDLLQAWPCTIILVAQAGLGTINHTSLSIEALERRGLTPHLVVLNGPSHPANERSLKRMFPHLNIVTMPQLELQTDAVRAAGIKLLAALDVTGSERPSEQQWVKRDAQVIWHPFTQHENMPDPIVVKAARGIWLETESGEQLIDGNSSWWTNTIGHGRPEIAVAIAKQQQKLDHVIFAAATHTPAIELSEQLLEQANGKLHRVFFSDNGSCAVEIAAKMVLQFWHNAGETKRRYFLTLKGGYHGDSFGAMALGLSESFHAPFKKFFFPTIQIDPVTEQPSYLCPEGAAGLGAAQEKLRQIFSEHHQELAGVLIEPLIQGAGGMLVHNADWLKFLGDLAQQHRIPLVLDEVFSGMGRVGTFYAFERAHLDPTIICLAKGLTGGNMPLAVTMAKEELFAGFLGPTKSTAFLHGHSFTANPIGCAAALATLGIYRRENLVAKVRWIESEYQAWLQRHAAPYGLKSPRAIGNILAFDLPHHQAQGYHSAIGQSFVDIARKHHLFLRPLGDTIYFIPPFVISPEELDRALADLGRSVEEWSLPKN